MTLAYCPAFDFDPEATKMTFDQILEILKSSKTDYQKAADLHAALTAIPSAVQPMKARKASRTRRKGVLPASGSLDGFAGHSEGEGSAQ